MRLLWQGEIGEPGQKGGKGDKGEQVSHSEFTVYIYITIQTERIIDSTIPCLDLSVCLCRSPMTTIRSVITTVQWWV